MILRITVNGRPCVYDAGERQMMVFDEPEGQRLIVKQKIEPEGRVWSDNGGGYDGDVDTVEVLSESGEWVQV